MTELEQGSPNVLTIHVTPVHEDGTTGDTIEHLVDVGEYEFVDNPGEQKLVVTDNGETFKYPLVGHTIELIPAEPVEPDPVGDEVPDDLGNHPDDVRAQYAKDQAAADRAWAAEQQP